MKPTFIFVKNFKNLSAREHWKMAGRAAGYLAGLVFLVVAGTFIYFAKDLPSPGKVNRRVIIESTKIYDRTGEHLLYEVHGEEKRTLISFSEIPDTVKYATIVLEDQDFYSHRGIKLSSIIRAAMKDILRQDVMQGGSTITQQFVKNSILSPERTLTRKVKEVILAIEIEQKFSKDEILGMYLNEIPFGSNAYGIEAAAQTYFGKPARELTLDEAALLAALPKAPTYYSPYGSHFEELKKRQEAALKRMVDLGYITQDQSEEAKKTDVLGKVFPYRERIDAPHFVMYVKEYLESKYGQQVVEQGGLKVYTTLDWEKQSIAEKAVRDGAEKNQKAWGAENAALVALDTKTGQILAMVGSKDYFDKSIDGQVNVAIRDRQPGSSFKPYVYLTAFAKGYTPETMIFDMETEFETQDGKEYKPRNYDGKFRGPVKMKEALGMSLNIPAVETLYLAGVKDSIATAKRMGITGLNQPERYGLSLVLGGGEVKLIDHASAFGTLATKGVRYPRTAVLKIEDSHSEVLEEFKQEEGEKVVEEKYVAMIDHILSTNDYRSPVFGSNSPLRFDDRPVAVKTGTTNEFRDGWTVGYTPSLVVGVWAGNNDNTPMREGADGVNVAAPIWRSFLDQVLGNYAIEQFPEYKKEETGKPILDGKLDIEKNVKVCEIPGEDNEYCLANKYCKDTKERDFIDAHTILWYVDKDNPRGDYPKEPQKDPQFKNWEKAVEKWYDKKDNDYVIGKPPEKECEEDNFSKYKPSISISVPGNVSSDEMTIKASADAPYGIDKVEFFVDGDKIASRSSKPYETSYSIPVGKKGSTVEVKVKVTDDNGNTDSDSKDVSIAP
ncbi:MAG: PBP1A family penicillin-binding protein [Candidatus Moranbacteria bacterium]|nr:PBP1A family penicillin-binding protein [Candidatus Moranbacteria bacterium]